jgi:CxxC motif-containing protein (DUF1111 family)
LGFGEGGSTPSVATPDSCTTAAPRNLEEAILWHGGEAAAAQRRFLALPARQRRELLAFPGWL